jgi:hypothetical protein
MQFQNGGTGLFAKNTGLTSRRCDGKIYRHTFNIGTTCHVKNCLHIAVAKMMMPGVEVRHPGCKEGTHRLHQLGGDNKGSFSGQKI